MTGHGAAPDRPQRVVVVGGGLSGLSAAYLVHREHAARGRAVEVTVVEATDRAGGNVTTVTDGDWLIDGGPDSWAAAKPHAAALCTELGLGGDLMGTLPENRKVYLVHQGRLLTMPDGIMLGVPTSFWSFARSPVMSLAGKARIALDLLLPTRRDGADESLGELVGRRMGREAVEALAAPLLGGIYAGDADRLSARATFPMFVEMEARHGSLVRGAMAARARRPAGGAASMFQSLRGGMGSLVTRLIARLPAGTVRTNTPVVAVSRLAAGDAAGRWAVSLGPAATGTPGETLLADHVVLAVPAWSAARLLSGTSPQATHALDAIPYASAATVFFGFKRADVDHPLDASGFVVPRREGMRILAGTWVSSKWAARAPQDHVLMRAFVGGVGRDADVNAPEDQLIATALADLKSLTPVKGAPVFVRTFRFLRTSPQPEVGHAERVARIREHVATLEGIHLVANAYDGVGMPDVIRLAGDVATRITAD